MQLTDALTSIANSFGFSAERLRRYADEDTLGGYHSEPKLSRWPLGSLWEVEAKTLFALTRELAPSLAIEIGTHRGASATHIASAMELNGRGSLVCLDINPAAGDMIPERLRARIQLQCADGADWMQKNIPDLSVGLIYEDADHRTDTTRRIWEVALRKIAPGGMIVTHDAAHPIVGEIICRGILQAGCGTYKVYRSPPSDCGLAIWRAPSQNAG